MFRMFRSAALATTLALGLMGTAQAATYDLIFTSNGPKPPGVNDCAGDFGNPPSCTYVSQDNYYFNGAGPDTTDSAYDSNDYSSLAMIGKIDNPFTTPMFTAGTLSATIGSFSFEVVGNALKWTYTPGSSLATIFAFSVKDSNRYNVYEISTAPLSSGTTQTSTGWLSPKGPKTGDISHVTFFGKNLPAAAIPLPSGLPLMLAGIGALVVLRRRQAA